MVLEVTEEHTGIACVEGRHRVEVRRLVVAPHQTILGRDLVVATEEVARISRTGQVTECEIGAEAECRVARGVEIQIIDLQCLSWIGEPRLRIMLP